VRLVRPILLSLALPAIAILVITSQADAIMPSPGRVADVTMGNASPNWAGYVAYGTRFRYVQATFKVPKLDCRKTPGTAVASEWVGLDGAGSHSVEQDGIAAQCSHDAASYYAWWETFPKPPVYPRWRVSAGDTVRASVWYDSAARKYRFDLNDQSNGHGFSDWEKCGTSSCRDLSAEVITEAPGKSATATKFYPFADCGTSRFWGISITDAAGKRGGFEYRDWRTATVTMVDKSDHVKAVTGGLGSGGTAFNTYWKAAD
jgi:hypothetical protein